jgi:hypothetical protein
MIAVDRKKTPSVVAIVSYGLLTATLAVDGIPRIHAQVRDGDTTLVSPAYVSSSGVATKPRSAVVMRFAFVSQTRETPVTLSEQTCPLSSVGEPLAETSPSSNDAEPGSVLSVDPKIQDKISSELEKRLSKKMPVTTDLEPASIPVGALVISGCITKASRGNAAERLAGMNLGASHIKAHVKVVLKTEAGFVQVDEFDVEAKGRMILPPLGPVGLATHVVAERRETLSADAKRLADQLLKKLAKTMSGGEQPAKTA